MCKCTPEIRTPFCGRGDCLPPGFANLGEWLGEQEAAAQMSLDRVWEQAVQQAMEGRKTDPGQAALNWAHNYAAKHQPRGRDSDADIAHLIVEQTKLIAELTIESGQLHIQLRQAEAHAIDMQEAYVEQYNRAEQAEARVAGPGMEIQGFHPCSKCEGRGFIRTMVDGDRDSEPCSYCRMSGRVMEEQR